MSKRSPKSRAKASHKHQHLKPGPERAFKVKDNIDQRLKDRESDESCWSSVSVCFISEGAKRMDGAIVLGLCSVLA